MALSSSTPPAGPSSSRTPSSQGLESGKVGGAAVDVVEDEAGICYYNRCGEPLPNRELALLRSYPNVIVSPHTAFYTDVNVASMVPKRL